MEKRCTKCNEFKILGLFKKDKKRKDGLSSWCKECHSKGTSKGVNRIKANINNANYKKTEKGKSACARYKRGRRAVHRLARPKWNDKLKIDNIYALAKKLGKVVDHSIPLNSIHVCGLHTQDNLVIFGKSENHKKSNIWWPDMWDYKNNFELVE